MKKFDIPLTYRSEQLSKIKNTRKLEDPRKSDFSPSILEYGKIKIYLARHFGFCYGVENAIEIAYKTIEENPNKRIFLLSEMIHNPGVNNDLLERGVKFLMDTKGNELFDWSLLKSDDIVIIPAFGTTIEIENRLKKIGINPYQYNTTCPFVEKVWNRAAVIGKTNTIVIHGKYTHEETRATFSHTIQNTKSIIIRDIKEANLLGEVILTESQELLEQYFKGKYSEGFSVKTDLISIGVVNQTTMLASETQEIAAYLRCVMIEKYGEEKLAEHFADTKDTLCYATNDNQEAAKALLNTDADLAVVVGGYNSSNTSHLVELLEPKFKTYFISSQEKIISADEVVCFNINTKQELHSKEFLPSKSEIKIAVTCGASCPDSVVERVINKILKVGKAANS